MTNQPQNEPTPLQWNEEASRDFLDYGPVFVPDRALQIEIICDLIPAFLTPFRVIELCSGEGLLADAILSRFPHCTLQAFDGSSEMLQATEQQLAKYGNRFKTSLFDLAETSWRKIPQSVQVIVSSLAIHHLDGPQKKALFADMYQLLSSDGVFVIADVIQPADEQGVAVAANGWDEAVKARSLALNNNLVAYNYFIAEKWNMYRYPDPIDKPSTLFEQLTWLKAAGFEAVDVFWMKAGHAIFGGRKR